LSLAAGFAGQALLVVSGIPVARTLSVDDRGQLALLVVVAGGLGLLSAAGVPDALAYYISRERAAARTLARRVVVLALAQASLVVLVEALVFALIFRHDPTHVKMAAAITLAWPPAFIAYAYGVAVLQGERRFLAFNVLRVLPAAGYSGFVIGAVVVHRTTVPVFAFGWVLSYVAAGAVALFLAARAVRDTAAESGVTVRDMMSFGVRGVLGQMSFTETFRVDQLVAGLFLGAGSLGLYAVASSFITLPMLVAFSIATVEYAHVAGQLDRSAARRTVRAYLQLTMVLCTTLVATLAIALPTLLPWLFGEKFADAVKAAQLLLVAGLARAARRILSDGLRGLGDPTAGSYAEIVSWVVLAAMLGALAPLYGINGVAAAVAISSAAAALYLLIRFTGFRALARRPRSRSAAKSRIG
jgi:O-antigen/teichoic acid export membrane protein